MNTLLKEEVQLNQGLVANKPVTLAFDGGGDFTILAPRRLVAAAIGNLIRNACLYTDQGRVSISVREHSVVVRDSGRGIPAEVLQLLSGEPGTHRLRGSEGTGLGLALVKRICRQLNVTLEVLAVEGGGTMFRMNFCKI